MQVEKIDFLTRILQLGELKFEPIAVICAFWRENKITAFTRHCQDIAKVKIGQDFPAIPDSPPGGGGAVITND